MKNFRIINRIKYFLYTLFSLVLEKKETEFEKNMREDPTEDIHSFMINKFSKIN